MVTEKILLFYRDFTDAGEDRFFFFSDGGLTEKNHHDVCAESTFLICHDYWLIASSLFKKENCLPINVIDIYEFNASISGDPKNRRLREKSDIKNISTIFPPESNSPEFESEAALITSYFDIFYKKRPFDLSIYATMAQLILQKWILLKNQANDLNEYRRYFDIEAPIFNILHRHVCPGILINETKLREHKKSIDYEYYSHLKNFSKKFSLPLEVPSDNTVIEYLENFGYDFDNYSVDHILNFIPTPENFSGDVLKIRKLSSSKTILSSITYSQKKCTPIIDTFGSKTSRIYFKDPSFQNMAKRHRDIITTDAGKILSYVDYDQFEVGIMAALSEDTFMQQLYKEQDIYAHLAEFIFNDVLKRKLAKRIFLSYAYGMKMNDIVAAAQSFGAERSRVKEFFRRFEIFETWKKRLHQIFLDTGNIGTIYGNFLRRETREPLTEKEKRSCVSQVVQGTASLIFKKALIEINNTGNFRIILPMHDAVLVEHLPEIDSSTLVTIFSDVMSSTLENKVTGKASLENFFIV